MTITIDLYDIPPERWVTIGVVCYLLLCYMLLGPILSRMYLSSEKKRKKYLNDDDFAFAAVVIWLLSPVTAPVVLAVWVLGQTVHPLICRLIFGSHE